MRNLRILLVELIAHFSYSAAIKYNPNFAGGTGCKTMGVIDNTCPTLPRQATNGAGGTIPNEPVYYIAFRIVDS